MVVTHITHFNSQAELVYHVSHMTNDIMKEFGKGSKVPTLRFEDWKV